MVVVVVVVPLLKSSADCVAKLIEVVDDDFEWVYSVKFGHSVYSTRTAGNRSAALLDAYDFLDADDL